MILGTEVKAPPQSLLAVIARWGRARQKGNVAISIDIARAPLNSAPISVAIAYQIPRFREECQTVENPLLSVPTKSPGKAGGPAACRWDDQKLPVFTGAISLAASFYRAKVIISGDNGSAHGDFSYPCVPCMSEYRPQLRPTGVYRKMKNRLDIYTPCRRSIQNVAVN